MLVIPQQSEHVRVLHFLGPRQRRGPGLSVSFHRVRSVFQEQLHQFDPTLAARTPRGVLLFHSSLESRLAPASKSILAFDTRSSSGRNSHEIGQGSPATRCKMVGAHLPTSHRSSSMRKQPGSPRPQLSSNFGAHQGWSRPINSGERQLQNLRMIHTADEKQLRHRLADR